MGTKEIVIRECREGDLPAVLDLMVQLGEFAPGTHKPDADKMKRTFTYMQEAPDVHHNLVCERGGRLVGFLSLCFYRSFLHQVGSALINELIVEESERGLGIGRRLVDAAVREARKRGMDEIEVSTETDNRAARAFYQKAGFDGEYVLLGREFQMEGCGK
jgi:ribosomal protein S18 acetylase RimI-like enzyme